MIAMSRHARTTRAAKWVRQVIADIAALSDKALVRHDDSICWSSSFRLFRFSPWSRNKLKLELQLWLRLRRAVDIA